MKVLYLITRAKRGGAQVHVVDLLRGFADSVDAVIGTGEQGYLCDEAARMNVPVHHLPHLVQPMRPIADAIAVREAVQLIRKEKPDLIHAHTSKAGLVGRIAGFLTGIPVVFTAHTWSFADGIPALQRRISIPIERLAAAVGGSILNVSEANRRSAIEIGIDPRKLHTVWNGIPDVATRAAPGAGRPTRLVMVARFAPQKDQQLLVQSLANVSGEWRLKFVGDGPTRASVEALARTAGLIDRIDFAGETDRIPEVLADSDVFVLATKWEGLPLSILEAMRAGLPVIASDVGGVRESVTDGVTGVVVRSGDPAAMAAALTRMVQHPELQREFGTAGRRRYEQDFTLQTMVSRTMNFYSLALRRGMVVPALNSANAGGRA